MFCLREVTFELVVLICCLLMGLITNHYVHIGMLNTQLMDADDMFLCQAS